MTQPSDERKAAKMKTTEHIRLEEARTQKAPLPRGGTGGGERGRGNSSAVLMTAIDQGGSAGSLI
jgi:hypothetical protein